MRSTRVRALAGAALLLPLLWACQPSGAPELSIDYEQYTLDNGLNVVLHQDRSDPVAAVAILYHVGSNRETVGRTGFAHLFEHMMFQSSQHVGEDEFFQKIQAAGGTLNGGTSNDQTIYFEIVPRNALETALWLESDRMGYLLPTVTQEAFLNQQGVVQNEKRQGVDNRPYGYTTEIIGKLLYPQGHPYSWDVIGSMEDLGNATVQDVRDFFTKWYGPNNATLVVAGDFDPALTRELIQKYFGDLRPSEPVLDPEPWRVQLTETKRAFHEDNFARSPELNMVFPTVEEYTPDAYALSLFGQLFSDGKDAPLYKVIVEEEKLAPSAFAGQRSLEITGSFNISVRAFPNVSLTEVESAVQAAFARFEEDGFTEEDLDRIKARAETSFYNGITSVMGKAFQLASYAEFAGSPGFISQDIQNSLAVTSEDVWRVYDTYIKGQPYVLTSFVPRGQVELVAEGSELYPVQEEPIQAAGGALAAEGQVEPIGEIPSSFDRSVEPPKGPPPSITLPQVWTHTYANGLRLYGIEQHEVPLVQFSLSVSGGNLLDGPEKVGVANLVSDLMMEGTANKTPLELEQAIDGLGASIRMSASRQAMTLSANGLKSKAGDIVALAQEILLQPRWDSTEFDRIKSETLETLNRQAANPASVANNVFTRLVYGEESVLGYPLSGTAASVPSITVEDLRAFYDRSFSPSVSYIAVAGDITQAEAVELFRPLETTWPSKDVAGPTYPHPEAQPRTSLYFVDIPGSRQSQIFVGHLSIPRTDPDFFPATVMNYQLGGNFNGVLNMILREEKGFTYGASSSFNAGSYPGVFTAATSVMSNATRESVEIIRDEIARYRDGIPQEELNYTQNALLLANARRFETPGALLGMLTQIATYDLPVDYVRQEEEVLRGMTVERHRELAQSLLDSDHMIYLVVGDASTQLAPLRQMGLGEPILLDVEGNPVG